MTVGVQLRLNVCVGDGDLECVTENDNVRTQLCDNDSLSDEESVIVALAVLLKLSEHDWLKLSVGDV